MRHDPVDVDVASRQQARATSTGWHIPGTVTNNVMVTVRRLVGTITVLSQRGSQSTSSLIRRALPRISGEVSTLQRLVSVLNDYCYSTFAIPTPLKAACSTVASSHYH